MSDLAEAEKEAVTAFIVSTEVCDKYLQAMDLHVFPSKPVRTLMKLVQNYHHRYGTAPGNEIEGVFRRAAESGKFGTAEATIIERILDHLSTQYDKNGEAHYNPKQKSDACAQFINHSGLFRTLETTQSFLESGQYDKAIAMYNSFELTESSTSLVSNNFADITDVDIGELICNPDAITKDYLCKLPGALGEYLGPFKRGWLISLIAGFKTGKTTSLLDIGTMLVKEKLNVLYIAAEGSSEQLMMKLYANLCQARKRPSGGWIYKPVMDCTRNQGGTCNKVYRPNKNIRISEAKLPPAEFIRKYPRHNPCTHCRGRFDFTPTSWWVKEQYKDTAKKVRKRANKAHKRFSGYFRGRVHPQYSLTPEAIKSLLKQYSVSEGWDCDVLIVDYADILASSTNFQQDRDRINHIWVMLSAIAQEMNCLVMTASQANREGAEANNINTGHTASDIRKVATVDILAALDQNFDEKNRNMMRLNVLAHRHQECRGTCTLVNDMSTGTFCLDSAISYPTATETSGKVIQ